MLNEVNEVAVPQKDWEFAELSIEIPTTTLVFGKNDIVIPDLTRLTVDFSDWEEFNYPEPYYTISIGVYYQDRDFDISVAKFSISKQEFENFSAHHEKLNNVAFRKWIKEKFSCQGFEVYKWETQKSFRIQLNVFARRNNRFDCNELVKVICKQLSCQS